MAIIFMPICTSLGQFPWRIKGGESMKLSDQVILALVQAGKEIIIAFVKRK